MISYLANVKVKVDLDVKVSSQPLRAYRASVDSEAQYQHNCTFLDSRSQNPPLGLLIELSHVRSCPLDCVIKVVVTMLHINCCLTVYGNGTQKNFDRLRKMLNLATRVIFGRRNFHHISGLRDKLARLSPKIMSDYLTLIIFNGAIGHAVR